MFPTSQGTSHGPLRRALTHGNIQLAIVMLHIQSYSNSHAHIRMHAWTHTFALYCSSVMKQSGSFPPVVLYLFYLSSSISRTICYGTTVCFDYSGQPYPAVWYASFQHSQYTWIILPYMTTTLDILYSLGFKHKHPVSIVPVCIESLMSPSLGREKRSRDSVREPSSLSSLTSVL